MATVSDTSIVENEADVGGGVYVTGFALSLAVAITTLVNHTVSGNIARIATGGVYAVGFRAKAKVFHSTIANNSLSGVNGQSVVTIDSTIVAGNSPSAPFSIAGFNLRSPTSAGVLGPLFGAGEPLFLDGNRMPVHALLPGSPAIDAGDPADAAGVGGVPELDQRGAPFGRVVDGDGVGGARIDIGAYERRADEALSFVVDTLDDDDGDDYSPGDRSLREAIQLANSVPGVNTITFAPALLANGPGAILLKYGEMAITEPLVIDGPGAEHITVDAQQSSRVFNITATSGDFRIEGLTVAHGRTTGNNVPGPNTYVYSGGAIRSVTLGTLTLEDMHIVDSGTTGTGAAGGGVFSQGPLVLNDSVVSGNTTAGEGAYGGGVATQSTVTLTDSTVDGNRVLAVDESGGGIWSASHVMITRSTISANVLAAGTTENPLVPGGGGGVASQSGYIVVTDSVVRDNVTHGSGGSGGGIRAFTGPIQITRSSIAGNLAGGGGGGVFSRHDVDVIDSTISGNTAFGPGGGIYSQRDAAVTNSTVSGNSTTGTGARAGGVFGNFVFVVRSTITDNHTYGIDAHGGGVTAAGSTTLSGSIVAGNTTSSGQGDDLWGISYLFFTLLGNNVGATGSFVAEAPVGSPDAMGNLIGGPVNGVINPLLGPLAFNGGPTMTHAVLPGSPAIDAGDPAAAAGMNGIPEFDQRGMPFVRVANGVDVPETRIDMGAVEWQVNPLAGDYNFDGVVNAADYSVWRNTLGSTTDLRADGTSASTPGAPDGVVDELDYAFWKANFGNVLQQGAGSGESNSALAEPVAPAASEAAGELRLARSAGATESAVNILASPARRSSPAVGAEDFAFTSFRSSRRTVSPRHDAATARGRTTHDEALVAWLARRDDQHTPDGSGENFEQAEDTASESAVGTLDEAFAALSGGY